MPLELTLFGVTSLDLSLLSRVLLPWRRCQKQSVWQLPLLRSLPLRRLPDVGQPHTSERNHPLGYGAFSAFLTLARPSSAQHLPAILGLVPPMGFPLQGPSSTCGAAVFSDGLAFLRFLTEPFLPQPSVVRSILGDAQLHSRPSVEATGFPVAPLQGFAPRKCRCLGPSFLNQAENNRPSWASPP